MRIYTVLLITMPILSFISCAVPGEIASLQKRVEENPESPQARYELALAYLKRGIKWEGPRDVGIPVFISKGWTKKAQREFQKVAELDPNLPEPHYWLKVIYNAQGRHEEADRETLVYTELMARKKRQTQ